MASPLWNLFYLLAIISMMGSASYSRHEHTQKLALCIFGIYIAAQIAIHTELMYFTYFALDIVGLTCVALLRVKDPSIGVTRTVFWLFAAMLCLHVIRGTMLPWLVYQIAGNLLFLAQLLTISIYGKAYGHDARINERQRNDPFYRFVTYARN